MLNDVHCPYCFVKSDQADDIAVHLMDVHAWDYEFARLWLREKVERIAFYESA